MQESSKPHEFGGLLTVGEAFARAGHPAPGCWLLRERNPTSRSVWYSADDPFATEEFVFSVENQCWVSAPLAPVGFRVDWNRDYSDERARPFYKALPECVRKVLDEVAS